MKLGVKTIEKLTQGALYFENRGGYLFPYHYSKNQLEHFKREGFIDGWLDRAYFHGGVFVRFITDATNMTLTYKPYGFSSDQNTIDVFVDNILFESQHIDREGKQTLECEFRHGVKQITIYLPFDCQLGLKSIDLNGAYRSVKNKGKKTLIIGDSITQGYGAIISSCAYVSALERKTGLNIVAQGIGGYRFEPADVIKIENYEPELIISALGTNYYDDLTYDYEKNASEYLKNLAELYKDKQILCLTPLWRFDADMVRFTWCINTMKKEASKYENITVIDGFDLVPNVDECFSDKVHPNAYGSEQLATNLMKFMKEIKF